MIGIVDHGVGNVGSIRNILDSLGEPHRSVRSAEDLASVERLVLPGVGAFDHMMRSLDEVGLKDGIKSYVADGRPLLAVCLGMQALFTGSEEGGEPGLGAFKGQVVHLGSGGSRDKVPHVGFNTLRTQGNFWPRFDLTDFYFVHSYALRGEGLAEQFHGYTTTVHGGAEFVSAFRWGRVLATQFHPEKSGEHGRDLVSEFLQC